MYFPSAVDVILAVIQTLYEDICTHTNYQIRTPHAKQEVIRTFTHSIPIFYTDHFHQIHRTFQPGKKTTKQKAKCQKSD